MAKWDNMLAILWLLRSRKQMTAEQISATLEISVRTVYRYINALCASGVPIVAESGHSGGYYLTETFRGAPLFFNSAELKAMGQAALFAHSAGYPFGDDLERALEKIQLHLNDEQMDFLKKHLQGFDVIGRSVRQKEQSRKSTKQSINKQLQQLEKAVANCTAIRLEYMKEGMNTPTERAVNPYGLAYWFEKWYMVGFCHERQELRTFRVDRIYSLSPTEQSFQRPAHFSVRHYLETSRSQYFTQKGSTMSVRIEGDATSLKSLGDHWYLRHCLVERNENDIHFIVEENAILEHMPTVLLTYGTKVRVLEPRVLQDKISTLIKKLAKHYEVVQLP